MGLRLRLLGTEALSWRDLWVILRHLPRESAVQRELRGEAAEWGISEQLLAGIFDVVRMGNWQRGGGQGPKPDPLPRPGVQSTEITIARGKPVTIEEANARLGWRKGGQRV